MPAIEPLADAPQPPPVPARPRSSRQILAGVCGAIVLVVAAVFTLGGAVLAVMGIGLAALIARQRSRPLSRAMSWLAAGVAVQITLLALAGYAAVKAPAGTLATIQHTMDSTQAHQPPPPAWLDRIAPGASARARSTQTPSSPAIARTTLMFTTIFGTGVLAAIVGTVGWLVAFPLAYALTGRWLGEAKMDEGKA